MDWSWIDSFIGAAIALVGWSVGKRNRKESKDKILCSCGHAPAFHDPQTKRCHHSELKRTGLDRNLNDKYASFECTCRQYDGPEKLHPGYYSPEIGE